jgi:hypothetical protein
MTVERDQGRENPMKLDSTIAAVVTGGAIRMGLK